MNIMVTSAGRRVSLVQCFRRALASNQINGIVVAVDVSPSRSAACEVADVSRGVPRINDPRYIDELLKLCLELDVKLVIPTIDTELMLLVENLARFEEQGIQVVVSSLDLVRACRDKRLTHQLFQTKGIDCANEYEKTSPKFPMFIKPYDGSCSVDTFYIGDENALTDYHRCNEKLMFLEYIDPQRHVEFTVDIYYDKNEQLKCIVPRERIEVRGGEVSKGATRKNFLVSFLRKNLSSLVGARGCITLQVFVQPVTQRVIGIEINPRFGGGYPLTDRCGADYASWLVQEYLLDLSIDYYDEWTDNLLMLRFDDAVYLQDVNDKSRIGCCL